MRAAGEVGKATAELEAMRGDGIEADRYSYNGLLTAHANAKPAPDAAAARGALSAMEAAGVAPDLGVVQLADHRARPRRRPRGRAAHLKGLGSRGSSRTAYSYTAAIGACADTAAASGAAAAAAALGSSRDEPEASSPPPSPIRARSPPPPPRAARRRPTAARWWRRASGANLLEAMSEAMLPCTAPALNAALGACAAAGHGDGLAAVRGPLEEADHANRAAPVDAHTIALLDDLLKAEEAAASAAAAPVDGGGAAAEKGLAPPRRAATRGRCGRRRRGCASRWRRTRSARRRRRATAAAEARFVDLFFARERPRT